VLASYNRLSSLLDNQKNHTYYQLTEIRLELSLDKSQAKLTKGLFLQRNLKNKIKWLLIEHLQ
jgi:hypothetical protein